MFGFIIKETILQEREEMEGQDRIYILVDKAENCGRELCRSNGYIADRTGNKKQEETRMGTIKGTSEARQQERSAG